jgi:tetratricopeptide (TPR) repeat protein
MKNEIELIKSLLLPLLDNEVTELNGINNWEAITNAFVLFESNQKPLYTEIYKLQTPESENIISELPELYRTFVNEIAEEYVLNNKNSTITNKLIETGSSIFYERVTFFKTLKSTITKQERLRISKELPNLSDRINFSFSDENIEAAIKKKAREDLKNKFKHWDNELEEDLVSPFEQSVVEEELNCFEVSLEGNIAKEVSFSKPRVSSQNSKKEKKVISLSWFKYGVAAMLVLSFFIWQPTQSTNGDLFTEYNSSINFLTQDNYKIFQNSNLDNGERGNDNSYMDYTTLEIKSILSGLTYFKEGNYDKSKSILTKINQKKSSVEVLYFLSLSQLNSNDIDVAISNLEFLKNKKDLKFSDDVKFHLAMGYIKKGNRKKSKIILKELIVNNSKFKSRSELILKKMRWF